MHRLMLHPCVSNDERSIGCGDFFSTTSILRFQSFFTQKRVVASYTFEVKLRPGISCSCALSQSAQIASHHTNLGVRHLSSPLTHRGAQRTHD